MEDTTSSEMEVSHEIVSSSLVGRVRQTDQLEDD